MTAAAWLQRDASADPFVYGHRGAPRVKPENTLAGFSVALDQGAVGVELDVRVCGSGEVVVIHDRDLLRVAQDPGVVADLSLSELQARLLGDDQRVPTLDQVIDVVRSRDRAINIEVKSDVPDQRQLCEAVADCIASRSDRDRQRLFLSTFHPAIVTGLRQHGVTLPIGFLFEHLHIGSAGTAAPTPQGVHPDRRIVVQDDVIEWKRRGLFVNVWTVNDPARALELAAWGVDALITDDVPTILSALDQNVV
jgi:glycerophosphoryl diester phosphodiesterase